MFNCNRQLLPQGEVDSGAAAGASSGNRVEQGWVLWSQRHTTVGLASCACMRSLASVCSFASRGWVTLHVLLLVC
jgi:hypothetical protein